MKRKLSRTQFIRRQTYDVNLHRAERSGWKARDEGKSLKALPPMDQYSILRATELLHAWKKGWMERDQELKPERLPYKE